MTVFIRLITAISTVCGVVAAALVAASLAIVCQMVAVRYIFGEPATWDVELVTYLMIALTFIGSPYALVTRGHVGMDVLTRNVGRRTRRMLGGLSALVALVFCAGLAWEGFNLLSEAFYLGWESEAVWHMGLWIPYLTLPLGITLLGLQYVADLLCYLMGREPPGAGGARRRPAQPAGL